VTKRLAQILSGCIGAYLLACVLNSYLGGYWLEFARDGKDRFAPELGGMSLTDAIMWQPRFGHCSLGRADSLGITFSLLIQIDQACLHRTHYLSDTNFDVWFSGLPPSKVHPHFRADFIRQRERPGP
jgi:hypothetical protein